MTHQIGTIRIAALLFGALLYTMAALPSMGATLLPNGKQTFTNANGTPLASGRVSFYIPGTLTPKTTWQDSAKSVANANPVILDSAGRAIIYGSGCYRQIVQTSALVTIWDQTTCDTSSDEASWAGLASGTPNAITVTADNFTSGDGQIIRFIAAATNTGAATLNPNGIGAIALRVDSGSGPIALTGNEMVVGNIVTAIYDANAGVFHLSTLTSVTAGGGLSTSGVGSTGGTITTGGTLTAVEPVNAQTGTTYTFLSSDNGKIVALSNTAAVAATLPQATGSFGAGFHMDVLNRGTGLVTITPTISTINGAASLTLPAGRGVRLVSDGTNWVYNPGNTGTTAASTGYRNLQIVNTSGSENTSVTVTADFLTLIDTSGNSLSVTSVNLNCNYTTVGANGLDAGALGNNTWYYHWVISTGSTTACLGSTSSTAPTMPSGYTFKMRVGASRTTGAAQLHRIRQRNNQAQYEVISGSATTTLPNIANGAAGTWSATVPTWAAVTVSGVTVPDTATEIGIVYTNNYNNLAIQAVMIAPTNSYNGQSSGTPPLLSNSGGAVNASGTIWFLLESTSIYWASTGGGGGISALGWKDAL